jgi:hypothetical protein
MSNPYGSFEGEHDPRERNFAGSGKNPFADDVQSGPAKENPYAPPEAQQRAYHPGDYEAVLPHRGGLVLSLGLAGLLSGLTALVCCGPLAIVSLALTIPAWMLGRGDLHSINAGAMDPSGRGMTMAGYVLGIVGTLITLLIALVMIGIFVVALLNSEFSF